MNLPKYIPPAPTNETANTGVSNFLDLPIGVMHDATPMVITLVPKQSTCKDDLQWQAVRADLERISSEVNQVIRRIIDSHSTDESADNGVAISPRSITIEGAALEQLKNLSIANRLVSVMRTTFGNPNIQVENCTFSAETEEVDGEMSRGINVRVNGSDTQLHFGFGQVGQNWQLGEIQLNVAEMQFVQGLFR